MKYRWEVLWSDGTRDTAVYAVERKLAERPPLVGSSRELLIALTGESRKAFGSSPNRDESKNKKALDKPNEISYN